MTTKLQQDIQAFCNWFTSEKRDIEDIAMKLQKLADRSWDEAIGRTAPSLKID